MSKKSSNNAVVYLRISTKKQSQGKSIEQQLADCKLFAKEKKYTITLTINDIGSGYKSGCQTELDEFLDDVENGEQKAPRYMICYAVDRFSRSVSQGMDYADRLYKLGITLVFVQNDVAYNPLNPVPFTVALAVAQQESAIISERSRQRAETRRRTGVRKLVSRLGTSMKEGKVVENVSESKVLKLIELLSTKGSRLTEVNALLEQIVGSDGFDGGLNFYGSEYKKGKRVVYVVDKIEEPMTKGDIKKTLDSYNIKLRGRNVGMQTIKSILDENSSADIMSKMSLGGDDSEKTESESSDSDVEIVEKPVEKKEKKSSTRKKPAVGERSSRRVQGKSAIVIDTTAPQVVRRVASSIPLPTPIMARPVPTPATKSMDTTQ